MKQINLESIGVSIPTRERLRAIALTIEPGNGIPIKEVANELGRTPTALRPHAEALGCYLVLYTNGASCAYITPIPE
jgi:hypothetical protein